MGLVPWWSVSAWAGRDSLSTVTVPGVPPNWGDHRLCCLGSAVDRGAEQEPRRTRPFYSIGKLGPFCNPGLTSQGH